jgi:hypothetical protein
MLRYRGWQRGRLRARYGGLLDEISSILFRHDPIGINFDDNTDEYDAEAATVLAGLHRCSRGEDVLRLVHREFTRWFGRDVAGPLERYEAPAADIWALWRGSPLNPRRLTGRLSGPA